MYHLKLIQITNSNICYQYNLLLFLGLFSVTIFGCLRSALTLTRELAAIALRASLLDVRVKS